MFIDRGMDKEDMAHIHNGTLLSRKKEQNCAICRDVDGPRDFLAEWSKSEREKQTSYIKAYMYNLEKWYRWTYLQRRKRDTDIVWTSRGEGSMGYIDGLGFTYIHYKV